jgi:PAS domain S-box-containing protein
MASDKNNMNTDVSFTTERVENTASIHEAMAKIQRDFDSREMLLIETCLISKADRFGRITYVNDKFCKVSGYSYEELIGADHRIVNSGYHDRPFWKNMYKIVIEQRQLWCETVVNKNKAGDLYWVKSWIKAEFDESDEFCGFISVRQDVTEIIQAKNEIDRKNAYLEHAAKILRHDMHSGINTYIPRGVSSLERRLTPEVIEQYKLEYPLKLLKEGLAHTQKVYKGVYEFTNLVKPHSKLETTQCDLKVILTEYLKHTAYISQVIIDDLVTIEVNESLFCTAIDNLIRNGLKYNDSPTKYVKIYMEDGFLVVQDNGRGMSCEEFEYLSKPYTRKMGQKESGSGLGLNICIEILKEHGFSVSCEQQTQGTKLVITL